ncbi:MAG TPA: alpha/beta fold hydrolase [Chloroflexota bacterium]|jgi:fermentation-respiration switch protein FrsA (DUF1100 family)|nr:alpha/beta fold hydrolase [Chloroflexota bacterium]
MMIVAAGTLVVGYAGISISILLHLVYAPPMPLVTTPAALGLDYRDVTFPSRGDHVPLRGWFMPGILPGGGLTAHRAIIVVHGARANRADPGTGVLALSAALARHSFAVLAFDLRGMGESPRAPLSMGLFEQRDALGAVDFLRVGRLPYPQLGRPERIGGWGVSMGAATLLMAAAHEPAIRAVVADSAYADIEPLMQRQFASYSPLLKGLMPGILLSARLLYGIDFHQVRPVAGVARLAPRPLLIIQGADDTLNRPADVQELAIAAERAPHADVQVWIVPGAEHGQSFRVAGALYVRRVAGFFDAALGPAARSG